MNERIQKFLQPVKFCDSRFDNHSKDTIYKILDENSSYEKETTHEDDEGDEYTDYVDVLSYMIEEDGDSIDEIDKVFYNPQNYYRIFELLIEETDDGIPIGIKKA